MLSRILAGPAKVRASVWLVFLVLVVGCGQITWAFLGAPALDNRTPSLLDLLGWLFWTAAFAVAAIWVCWKKTDQGWRWRWSRH